MIKDLIGVSYRNKGRDLVGADCWGLLRLFYIHEMGVLLPSYDEFYVDAFDKMSTSTAIQEFSNDWTKVDIPQYGDGIKLRLMGHPCHVGVYLGNSEFLHTQTGHNSCIDRLDSVKWRHRIEGYYRHKSQMKD
jgi:cell wall-associated NlpC family hydrolase